MGMRFIRNTLLAVAFLLCLWLTGLAVFTAIALSYPKTTDTSYDIAIVLTGGQYRVTAGLDLLARNKVKTVFISGVNTDTTMDDITGLASDPESLPDCCIVLERKATTTRENAAETIGWFRAQNITSKPLLITSSYHMPRALTEFTVLNPDPLAVSSARDRGDQNTKFLVREYHKTLFRLIAVHIFKDTPS